jgi:hypothetical protein
VPLAACPNLVRPEGCVATAFWSELGVGCSSSTVGAVVKSTVRAARRTPRSVKVALVKGDERLARISHHAD